MKQRHVPDETARSRIKEAIKRKMIAREMILTFLVLSSGTGDHSSLDHSQYLSGSLPTSLSTADQLIDET
jgi:hypothetical protein